MFRLRKVGAVLLAVAAVFQGEAIRAGWIRCDWTQRQGGVNPIVSWDGDYDRGQGMGPPLVQGEWKGLQGPWAKSLTTNWVFNPNGWGATQPSFAPIFVRGRLLYMNQFGQMVELLSNQVGPV